MGKLIYSLNVSLDGFIETPDHGIDWAVVDDEVHSWFNDQARALDASLYGRRMYELMADYWPTGDTDPAATGAMRESARIWKPMPKIVFSTSLDRVDHNARLVQGDVGPVLEELRREFGGRHRRGRPEPRRPVRPSRARGRIPAGRAFRRDGCGTPFWPDLDAPLPLRLVETRSFASGAELRSYVPA
jgi:dihydrofolate reductase